jgi:hypothetical protein
MKKYVAKGIPVYKFSLYHANTEQPYMHTELDEPDPRADLEFWEAFMTGEYYLRYNGEAYEIEPVPDTDNYTTMYCMEGAGKRATLLISNGLGGEYLVTCVYLNGTLKTWMLTDDYDTARKFGEDFVMGRDTENDDE